MPVLEIVRSKGRKAMLMVQPKKYGDFSQNATSAHVTLYDLRPHPDASFQIVAAIRIDGKPFGFAAKADNTLRVWASFDTAVTHFREVMRPRQRLDFAILTADLPQSDAEAFGISPVYKDSLLALGPRDAIGFDDGSRDTSDPIDA